MYCRFFFLFALPILYSVTAIISSVRKQTLARRGQRVVAGLSASSTTAVVRDLRTYAAGLVCTLEILSPNNSRNAIYIYIYLTPETRINRYDSSGRKRKFDKLREELVNRSIHPLFHLRKRFSLSRKSFLLNFFFSSIALFCNAIEIVAKLLRSSSGGSFRARNCRDKPATFVDFPRSYDGPSAITARP